MTKSSGLILLRILIFLFLSTKRAFLLQLLRISDLPSFHQEKMDLFTRKMTVKLLVIVKA